MKGVGIGAQNIPKSEMCEVSGPGGVRRWADPGEIWCERANQRLTVPHAMFLLRLVKKWVCEPRNITILVKSAVSGPSRATTCIDQNNIWQRTAHLMYLLACRISPWSVERCWCGSRKVQNLGYVGMYHAGFQGFAMTRRWQIISSCCCYSQARSIKHDINMKII